MSFALLRADIITSRFSSPHLTYRSMNIVFVKDHKIETALDHIKTPKAVLNWKGLSLTTPRTIRRREKEK
jgi:hypothetical protein